MAPGDVPLWKQAPLFAIKPVLETPPPQKITVEEYRRRLSDPATKFSESYRSNIIFQEMEKVPQLWIESDDEVRKELSISVAVEIYNRSSELLHPTRLDKLMSQAKEHLEKLLENSILRNRLPPKQMEEHLWKWDRYPFVRFYRDHTQDFEKKLKNQVSVQRNAERVRKDRAEERMKIQEALKEGPRRRSAITDSKKVSVTSGKENSKKVSKKKKRTVSDVEDDGGVKNAKAEKDMEIEPEPEPDHQQPARSLDPVNPEGSANNMSSSEVQRQAVGDAQVKITREEERGGPPQRKRMRVDPEPSQPSQVKVENPPNGLTDGLEFKIEDDHQNYYPPPAVHQNTPTSEITDALNDFSRRVERVANRFPETSALIRSVLSNTAYELEGMSFTDVGHFFEYMAKTYSK